MSSSAATTRTGDSKNTSVGRSRASASSALRRPPGFAGRKPTKRKRSLGSPQTDTAAVTALGPGTGTTAMPAPRASRTSASPGSDTVGVPASDTSATSLPARSVARIWAPLERSLCWKYDVVGVPIPCASRSLRVRRVSSQATSATSRSTRSARSVTSSRFPSGVATT